MRGTRPGRAIDIQIRRAGRFVPGSTVLVAVSGGPDSVVLAAAIDRIAREDGFSCAFAHVNHGRRPSAWQDECVVLSLGARLERPVRTAALAPGAADEGTLRVARYAALAAIARDTGASVILTAHTAEDQTETVLLALFRGSGLDGLGGMPVRRALCAGIELVRPLLRVTRDALHAELRRLALPYAMDPSNASMRYKRNVLRARLDDLRTDFPNLDAAVARCAEIVRAERSDDDRARARRALRGRLRERGLLRDIPFERIEAALDASSDARVFLKTGVDVVGGEIDAPGL